MQKLTTVLARLTDVLARHAEDAALSVGLVMLGVGCGAAFGWPFGLIVVGALLVVIGFWLAWRR